VGNYLELEHKQKMGGHKLKQADVVVMGVCGQNSVLA
jgi:hypothetical protein